MANVAKSIEELISIVKSNAYSSDIRAAAAEGLGYAGGEVARNALLEVVKSNTFNSAIRATAAKAVGRACGKP